jgi:hypothetical protein
MIAGERQCRVVFCCYHASREDGNRLSATTITIISRAVGGSRMCNCRATRLTQRERRIDGALFALFDGLPACCKGAREAEVGYTPASSAPPRGSLPPCSRPSRTSPSGGRQEWRPSLTADRPDGEVELRSGRKNGLAEVEQKNALCVLNQAYPGPPINFCPRLTATITVLDLMKELAFSCRCLALSV